MTDTRTMLNQIVSQTTNFINFFESMELLADRIASDSALSTALAAAATTAGRTDLTTANFDNLKLAVQQIRNMLEAPNANVPNGGNMVLSFYEVM